MVSLQELFSNAGKIEDLNSDNPLVNGGLYRLLIAIIHRAINGPKDENAWMYLWNNDGFPRNILEAINSYLEKWYERFFVFHEQYPFYQVPDLDESNAKTIAVLAPQLASGANRTLFSHCYDDLTMNISIDQAIRWTIALQNYCLGGLNTPYESTTLKDTRKNNKSAMGGPLAQAALVIITGKTFYKTLLLNLHRYNIEKQIPYKFGGHDNPVWERDSPTLPDERMPLGLVDWYTFQPRAIKLIRNNEYTSVTNAILMVGERLPAKEHRKYFEMMVAFRNTKGNDPFSAINFTEQKALWRDLNALMQTIEDTYRPKTMDWISDLIVGNNIQEDFFPLQLFGACSNQASFIQFRYETLPFNPKRLSDSTFILNINEYLKYVERVGNSLWTATRSFIVNSIPDLSQKAKTSVKFEKRDNEKIAKKIDNSNILVNFWNQAGIHFDVFLFQNLKKPDEITLSDWEEKNKQAGSRILKEFLRSNNLDAQALKAGTIAIKIFFKRLKND